MGDTRVKINIHEGTVEIEGSEEFVEKHYEELKKYLEHPPPQIVGDVKTKVAKTKHGNTSNVRTSSPIKKQISYVPIPVDLKGDQNKPALKEFFDKKNPKSNQEIITLFAYYLDKYCTITDMEFGHAISCYNEIGTRKPRNLLSLCQNVRSRGGWLEIGSKPYTFKINISGQNLVEQDLPHKESK